MADPHPHRGGLLAAFGHAFAGLGAAWSHERNFRIIACAAVVVLLAALGLRLSLLGEGLVVLAVALVLAAELLNSALEALVDLVSPGLHPLAGRAKDMGAAAVLVASAGAVAVGILVGLARVV